LRQSR